MLTRLELSGFRGFADAASLDCEANAVILVGPNGSGKTTFFDAIEWALLGEISRLPATRDAVGESYVANRFEPSRPTEVALHLTLDDGHYAVRRDRAGLRVSGDDGHEVRGKSASNLVAKLLGSASDEPTAARTCLRSHCLGQDLISTFVKDTTPRERFDSLSTLLGVEMVRRFYKSMEDSTGPARDRIDSLEGEIARLDGKLRDGQARMAALSTKAKARSAVTVERINQEIADLEAACRAAGLRWPTRISATDLSRQLSVLEDLIAQSDSRQRQCVAASSESKELAARQPAMEDAQQRLPALTVGLRAVRAAGRVVEHGRQLAAAEFDELSAELAKVNAQLRSKTLERESFGRFLVGAQPFLRADRCPVCEQSINPTQVLARIAARTKSMAPSERALLEKRDSVEGRLQVAKAKLDGVNARAAATNDKEAKAARAVADAKRAVETWSARYSKLVETWSPGGDLSSATRVAAELGRRLSDLRASLSRLQSEARMLVDLGELAEATESVRQVQDKRRALALDEKRFRAAEATLTKVVRDAKSAEVEIVERAIERQMPVLKAIYSRLNPHPLFDSLEVAYDTFAGRGEVYYRATRGATSGNVSMMFSSAQLNAVAVCIFLSLSLLRPQGGFSWVLLDDPIQNMDDYNILGLVDLLRSIRGERQVIVSTHDEQIGELLRRKLRPQEPGQRTAVHRFVSIDKNGPKILSTVDEYRPAPFVLESVAVR